MKKRSFLKAVEDRLAVLLGGGGCLFMLALVVLVGVGWVNHIIVCFREGEWGFLIAGALFFPIGIIHGWGRIWGWW